MSSDGSTELKASVRLATPVVEGVLSIEELMAGPPSELVVEWLDTACGLDATPDFYLNEVRFSLGAVDGADPAACAPRKRTQRITDSAALAAAWREGGPNVARFASLRSRSAVAWARVRVGEGFAAPATCLFDVGGGGCAEARAHAADSARGPFDVSATLSGGGAAVPRTRLTFSGQELSRTVDVSGFTEGRYAVCVAAEGGADCAELSVQGELVLRIEGAESVRQPPVAVIASASPSECSSPDGGTVSLDGSASTGDIVSYEWIENFGSRTETLLGQGARLSITLPLGPHALTLRVTDVNGQSSAAQAVRTVVDTVAPMLRITMTPPMLWPADHRMVSVSADPVGYDACGIPTLVLTSVTSTEPDDAPGDVDGSTLQDIQNAAIGTNDRTFSLRAETGTWFGGRRYLVTYTAIDGSGNRTVWRGPVAVRAPRRQPYPIRDDDKVELEPI